MSLKTKLTLTVVSMICTICILLVGVWAVVEQSKGGVINSAELVMRNIEGTLVCSRYGAGEEDFEDVLLYTEDMGLDEKKTSTVFGSTDFAKESFEIVYLLYFELDQTCMTETWINLENVTLDNTNSYHASYKFVQSKEEPTDWTMAENIKGTIAVTHDRPYLWMRISLSYVDNPNATALERASWGYKLQFYGNMHSVVE